MCISAVAAAAAADRPPNPPSWQVGRLVPDFVRQLVSSIGPNAQQLVNAFGIPDHLVAAPIAGNWELYNTYDNQGELLARR